MKSWVNLSVVCKGIENQCSDDRPATSSCILKYMNNYMAGLRKIGTNIVALMFRFERYFGQHSVRSEVGWRLEGCLNTIVVIVTSPDRPMPRN